MDAARRGASAARVLPAAVARSTQPPVPGGHQPRSPLPIRCSWLTDVPTSAAKTAPATTTAAAAAAAAAAVAAATSTVTARRHHGGVGGDRGRRALASSAARAVRPNVGTTGCSAVTDTDTSSVTSGGGSDGGSLNNGGSGDGGNGGSGGGGASGRGAGGAGGPPPHPSVRFSPAVAALILGGAAAVVDAIAAPPPAAAAAAAAAGHTSTSSADASPSELTGGAVLASTAADDATLDRTDGGPQQRLKRLMREAFAELTELRLRLEALEAAGAAEAEAAGEAVVVPLEGFAVRPLSRALAPGLRLRCAAQVSGTLDAPVLVPLAAAERAMDTEVSGCGDAAGSDASQAAGAAALAATHGPSWSDLVAEAGLCSSPRLRLRIQSVWGHNSGGDAGAGGAAAVAAVQQPLGRRGAGRRGEAAEAAAAAAAAEEDQPVAAHLQFVTAPGGTHLEMDKLLLKAEAHPRLRLLLATRGSLENIGKNVNPFAAGTGTQRGLTEAMRRGHDLALLSEGGGFGAAAAASAGDLSLAVGAFSGGGSCSGGGGGGADAAADAASARGGGDGGATTSLQLSLHRSRRLALSALWSSSPSSPSCPSCPGDAAPAAEPWQRGSRAGSLAGEGSEYAAGGGGGEGRRVQRGVVAAAQLTERLTAAVWAGEALSVHPDSGFREGSDSPPGGVGGDCDVVVGGGAAAAAAPAHSPHAHPHSQPRWRERRVGLRLATLSDVDTGRSYGLSVCHRRRTGAGAGAGSAAASVLVAEASAALPLAHGVMLTPGLVLLRHSGAGDVASNRTLLMAVAQTNWSF